MTCAGLHRNRVEASTISVDTNMFDAFHLGHFHLLPKSLTLDSFAVSIERFQDNSISLFMDKSGVPASPCPHAKVPAEPPAPPFFAPDPSVLAPPGISYR